MNREAWNRLQRAADHYENLGFQYVDVDWAVDKVFTQMTKPTHCSDIFLPSGNALVGSAEQSFLSIFDRMDDGLYYAITPCFRDEPQLTRFHQEYFMKLELFSKDIQNFNHMFNAALNFFMNEADSMLDIKIVRYGADTNYVDIFHNGVEVGSYYLNNRLGRTWICGTGLAEPRFTKTSR